MKRMSIPGCRRRGLASLSHWAPTERRAFNSSPATCSDGPSYFFVQTWSTLLPICRPLKPSLTLWPASCTTEWLYTCA
ncbi:hypothetical protein C8F01DRAFT_1370283 [Mycena amicta]|nr:hypothetical protein C8F01DRAFT_1370283 [Mycena amicta]